MIKGARKNLPDAIDKALKKSPLIIGVGPTAWPRMLSAFYFPKFKTISYYDTQDNDLIKKSGIEVFSLKELDPYLEVSPVTPGNILSIPLAKKYLSEQKEPFVLLVYKSFGKLERICEKNGWRFLGNKKDLIDTYENKKIFKETLREIGIEAIPGENIPIEELTKEKFIYYQEKLGQKKLVLQLAEVTYGGGSGTLFIDDASKLESFYARVKELKDALGTKKDILTVNVAPFIEGTTTSIACCTTKFGVLTGPLQNQIIDIKEVGAVVKNRSGNFAGHDWAFKYYPEDCQIQAQKIAERFGDFLYKKGFKGIFGLDLIVDNNGKVWPVECNPRETDAFPLICMLQMENRGIPMQVFHNLEHLNIEYNINLDEVNRNYKKKYNVAQILLYNPYEENVTDRNVFRAGIYKVKNKELIYERPGFLLSDLRDESEFLFTEDISKKKGKVYKPHERIFRLIKRGGILKEENSIKDEIKEVVNLVYKQVKLIPVESGLVNSSGLNQWFTNRIIDLKGISFENIDVLNIISDTGNNFRKPIKITWRKPIDKTPVIEQIRSKRARKQITSDMKKLSSLGIEIEIKEDLDQETFESWFSLYQKIISAKEKGSVVINKDWLKNKKDKNKKVKGIFAYKDGKIIGGQLFTEAKGILGVSYSASEKIESLAGSLTLLMDYEFLVYAQKKGYKEVSFGQDTNLYGHDLSVGLINYKAKLGFIPHPANKTYYIDPYFFSFDKFDDPVVFFSGEEELTMNVIYDSEDAKEKVLPPIGIKETMFFKRNVIVSEAKKQIQSKTKSLKNLTLP